MKKTLNFIKEKTHDFNPDTAMILGSGLGSFADEFEGDRLLFNDIPDFEKTNVDGHKGQLVFAEIEGHKTVIMQGRYHFYEGYSLDKVVYPIKVFKNLGVKNLIVTNAAGSTSKDFQIGDLMLITDHINMMGVDPLRGANDEELGTRFPDMSEIYKKDFIAIAERAAFELGIKIRKGVYCAKSGPSYETPAEINMLKIIGADAVGMSTVPETIVANYCGIGVLGISCLTNYAAGVNSSPLSHAEVIETSDRVKTNFVNILWAILKKMPK